METQSTQKPAEKKPAAIVPKPKTSDAEKAKAKSQKNLERVKSKHDRLVKHEQHLAARIKKREEHTAHLKVSLEKERTEIKRLADLIKVGAT